MPVVSSQREIDTSRTAFPDTPMSQTPATSGLSRTILKHLSHPLKLRLVLCAAAIMVWYALFLSPLSEQVSATTARIGNERKRVATARQIEQLKKSLLPHRDLAGAGDDVHELIRHVIGRIRTSPLRLIDLKPENPRDLGPYQAIGLQLSLEGGYTDIDEFLAWAETEKRLLRIDAIRLAPNSRDPGRVTAQLTLLALAEKTSSTVKTKGEAGKQK
jgi:Tfp pilus assembly protein PilO